MAHPWHHAMRSARRYGGIPEDYLETHTWFDYTKSHLADCRHRLFLHNAWGIFVAERILGVLLTRRSDNQSIPLRPIIEQHILEDFGKIPTLASCLAQLPPEEEDQNVTVYEQCQVSAARWGGVWSDYQDIHQFLDWPRDHVADGRHRRVLHNTWGISMAVQACGPAYARPSDGASVAVQPIAEHHVRYERGTVPSLEACLEGITLERWMCARALAMDPPRQRGDRNEQAHPHTH